MIEAKIINSLPPPAQIMKDMKIGDLAVITHGNHYAGTIVYKPDSEWIVSFENPNQHRWPTNSPCQVRILTKGEQVVLTVT